ncbi:MAG: hypothetical protein ABSE62_12355 [Chthoniobacteraceae bacterium]
MAGWLRSIEARSAAFRKHPLCSFTVWFGAFSYLVYCWFHPQMPGVAAVVMGGVTVLMQVILEMKETGKILFGVLILGLIGVESKAISKQSSDQASDQSNRDAKFAEIISQNKISLQAVTEGDSYAYVVPSLLVGFGRTSHPQSQISIEIRNSGNYALLNVKVSICLLNGKYGIPVCSPINIPILTPHGSQSENDLLTPDSNVGTISDFIIFLSSDNSDVMEDLNIRRRVDNDWEAKFQVIKSEWVKTSGTSYRICTPVKIVDWTNNPLIFSNEIPVTPQP